MINNQNSQKHGNSLKRIKEKSHRLRNAPANNNQKRNRKKTNLQKTIDNHPNRRVSITRPRRRNNSNTLGTITRQRNKHKRNEAMGSPKSLSHITNTFQQ